MSARDICDFRVDSVLSHATDTDEQLEERRRNFDDYKRKADQKLKKEAARLEDALRRQSGDRDDLMNFRQERGGLEAEARVRLKPSSLAACFLTLF